MTGHLLFPLFLGTVFLSFFMTVIATRSLIQRLRRKQIGQTILEIGPKWHKPKEGTPTMGGIAFLSALFLALLLFFVFSLRYNYFEVNLKFLFTVLFLFANGGIGLLDDLTKHLHRQNEGLRARTKFLLQAIVAALYLLALSASNSLDTSLSLPFLHTEWELGIFFYPFAFIFLVGMVNSVNLTDGIDGLAASVTLTVGGFLCLVSVRLFDSYGLFLSACIVGSCIGFLLFNAHPARIFMGDTGSLFLGAAVAGMALYLDILPLVCLSGIFYLIEALSVILQVGYFKLTRKRLFKMAPFHHHLEQCGYSEEKIVFVAVFVTLLFSLIAFFA